MRYKCLCGYEWGDELDEDGLFSHGMCFGCLKRKLTPIYKKRQRLEHNPDCFGTANGYCDQVNCKYIKICVEGKIK